MILSVSRRTDIPSFYAEWFVNRLAAGEVLVRNPMNRAQVRRVPLSPGQVDCIVFWTKDPGPLLPYLPRIAELGYAFYFQFTLTPYGRELEPGLRPKGELLQTFRELSGLLGPERVLWRNDPIVLNADWSAGRHKRAFKALCERLEGSTGICTVSFVDYYQKRKAAFADGLLRELAPEEMADLSAFLSRTAAEYGIEVRACCEAMDLTPFGIRRGSCIDRALAERICGHPIDAKPDANQRPGCGCAASVDIGAYDTCLHGCVYCYANHAGDAARHDPKAPMLLS